MNSNTAPYVILKTFHILFKFVSYLSYIIFNLLSTFNTFYSIDSNLKSTNDDILFYKSASFTPSPQF